MPDILLSTGSDNSGVAAGMGELRNIVKSSESAIQGSLAAAFAGGSIVAAIGHIVNMADRLQDLSDRFGVSTKILQSWGNAAETNGSSMEALAQSFNKLEIAKSKASQGDEAMVKNFEALGVSFEDLQKLSPEQIMLKIGAGSLEAANLVSVLGKNATELVPLLQGLADGTIKAGDAWSEGTTKALADANDTFKEVGQTLTIFAGKTLGWAVKKWQEGIALMVAGAFGAKEAIGGAFEAISKAIHFDFSGARDAITNAASRATSQFNAGFDQVREIETPPAAGGPPRNIEIKGRSSSGSSGGGGGGGSSGGSGNLESLQSQLARIKREAYNDSLSAEEKLKSLVFERNFLEGLLNANKKAGTSEDAHGLQLQIDIEKSNKEIRNTQKEILAVRKRATEEAIKAREEADREAAAENERLAALKQENYEKWVRDHNGSALGYGTANGSALGFGRANGSALDDKGYNERSIDKYAGDIRKDFAAKYGALADGLENAAPDALLAILRANDPTFGSHGAGGGPNFYEQSIIRAREQAAVLANQRNSLRVPTFNAAGFARSGFSAAGDDMGLLLKKQDALIEELRMHTRLLSPQIGG